jgi:hypothetical protein
MHLKNQSTIRAWQSGNIADPFNNCTLQSTPQGPAVLRGERLMHGATGAAGMG